MWIVSQDGNSIINADRMNSIVKVDALIVATNGETSSTIGIYSTKEKAKAVMKQLIECQRGYVKFDGTRSVQRVFSMPADEEVIICNSVV